MIRALIPCGGKGTRMVSLTGGGAKELIPVHGEPLLHHVLRECAASGLTDVLIVGSPAKEDILRDCVASVVGSSGFPRHIDFVIQHTPRGLADAIRLGRDYALTEPLAVVLPDNLFISGVPGIAQVVETYHRTGMNVVAVVEIFREEASRRGATPVYPGRLAGDEFYIESIPNKGTSTATFDSGGRPSAFTGVGRYIFLPDVFDVIDAVERTLAPGAELDDIPVLQQLLVGHTLIGRRMHGRFLDVGLPVGYAEATETAL